MPSSTSSRWCILRASGPRTLKLAKTLVAAGIDAWTPTAMVKRRIPRKPGRVEKPAPLLPTFVFVREAHLPELFRISRMPGSPHPSFAIFRFANEVVFVREAEVDRLRLLELRMTPKRRRPVMEVGAEVRPTEGAYAGLTGIVKQSDGKLTLVGFGGWMDVKIETSTLIDLDVEPCARSMSAAA